MTARRIALTLFLSLASVVPAFADDDAAALRELRARIERQAAELDALRAEVARLEAKLAGPAAAPSPEPKDAAPKDIPLTAASTPVTFAGLFQGWFTADDGAASNTFRIRRAELRFTGNVVRGVGWTVMIDPAKSLSQTSGAVNQASRVFQDGYLTLPLRGGVTLTAGQYKIPLTMEGPAPSNTIETVDRALFASDRTRGGNFGDVRDIGIMAKGTLQSRYDYQLGVFNGLGDTQNDVDRNDRKAVIGRFVARLGGGLQVGASGGREGERDRIGAEALFVRGPLKLKSELIKGREDAFHRRGGYVLAAYQLTRRLEAVGRFDTWDPDTSRDTDAASALERDYVAGLNLRPRDGLRLQANAVHKTFRGGTKARTLLLINLETAW